MKSEHKAQMDKVEGSMNLAERRWNDSENRIPEMKDVGRRRNWTVR